MKELTKEQLKNLHGFKHGENQVLNNGEVGHCKEKKVLVVCCRNCGEFHHVKMKK